MRMDTDLRIPLTGFQKQVIVEATKDEPAGIASWARQLLLGAANEMLARQNRNVQKE
jgi:hypothetical protein